MSVAITRRSNFLGTSKDDVQGGTKLGCPLGHMVASKGRETGKSSSGRYHGGVPREIRLQWGSSPEVDIRTRYGRFERGLVILE